MPGTQAIARQRPGKLLLLDEFFQHFSQEPLLFRVVPAERATVSRNKGLSAFSMMKQPFARIGFSKRKFFEIGIHQTHQVFAQDRHADTACRPCFVFDFLCHPEMAQAESASVQKARSHQWGHHAFIQERVDALSLRGPHSPADSTAA